MRNDIILYGTEPVTPRGAGQEFSYDRRPEARGKFLFIGGKKFYVCGVTYGTFAPGTDGAQFPAEDAVARDFARMRENGINTVRVYTVPPVWLLDCAQRHGLRVMVGMPWEQHVTFLDDKKRAREIEERVRAMARGLNRHPAILMYAVGNEIPPSVVRWHGRARVERFLKRLYRAVKAADPEGLVTYVNYPTTEFLCLGFFDLMCFNVYLEDKKVLEAYLYRLQNIADEKPLVMAEIGLDSLRNGEAKQAEVLDWQVKTAFAAGCAGAFIFAWTDEWHRGGVAIEDWDFGLTTRAREPKLALAVIKRNFTHLPFPADFDWPRISVFVCSCNGARTIRRTLEGLRDLHYGNYEVVVVDDGSKDATPRIAAEFPDVRLISTENRGLSVARNEALKDEAAGIVAYIDDDAYPDPDWLKYIAYTFMTTDYAAVGGPNFLPLESGLIANCVGNAPGGATHVLIGNTEAEHIPGCNMAYRKEALKAIGGFDSRFRAAGDDVDLCWRIMKEGWKVGYHPAAFVWHHRRGEIKAYWKQQFGYGKAEAMLEDKWPDKYNAIGHIPWGGRLYGRGRTIPLVTGPWRVYQGVWGSALFQSIYEPAGNAFLRLPLMPEWYLLMVLLAVLSFAGLSWQPLLFLAPVLAAAAAVTAVQATLSASKAVFTVKDADALTRFKLYTVTAFLHILQPLARLYGRIRYGLTPWKINGNIKRSYWPRERVYSVWSERWRSATEWLGRVEDNLERENVPYHRGGDYDNWDIEARGGFMGAARVQLVIEEHGRGNQMLRFRVTPNFMPHRAWVIGVFFGLAILAARDLAVGAVMVLGGITIFLALRVLKKCAFSTEAILQALELLGGVPISYE